jgi:hypothetical protein
LWGRVGPIAPRMPGLIWVLDRRAGDVMVDGSLRGERLRPLVLCWITAGGRVSQKPRELTGRLGAIWEMVGPAERVGGSTEEDQPAGSSACGPSSRRVWKQRRASLRAIVIEARGCVSPRSLSAR